MVFGGRAWKRPEMQIDILPQGETDTVTVFLLWLFLCLRAIRVICI